MTRRPVPLSEIGVAYSWQQLAMRAGLSQIGAQCRDGIDSQGIPFHYGPLDGLKVKPPCVVVTPCRPDAWWDVLQRKPGSVTWLEPQRTVPRNRSSEGFAVPVLFRGQGQDGVSPFAEFTKSGALVFHTDIIATAFFMLTRWEETVVPTRDEHGRFPAVASVAYNQGFLDRPIVDEYALILREWLKVLLPRWEPRKRAFSVQLSHDIDHIRRFPSPMAVLRCVGGDLLKRRSPTLAYQALSEAAVQVLSPDRTDYMQGIQFLAERSRKNGLGNDVFYFMASAPGPFEGGYDPASAPVKRCIENLQKQGFEIGLHASYDAFGNPERLAKEKKHLEAAVGQPVRKVRQHYLRFRVPNTWRDFEHVGLTCDSTMTYADHEGFRCGTSHSFHPFDLDNDRELDVLEDPLVAMDTTLARYRNLSPTEGKRRMMQLAQRCQQVEGTFTLMWHNSTLSGNWLPWSNVYSEVVEELGRRSEAAHGGNDQ